MKFIESNLVDIHTHSIYPVSLSINNGVITSITKIDKKCTTYILPGFVDAHIHIESSMLIPSEFAKIALTHGSIATVSDPHEIANVLGIKGVDFMINNAKESDFKFYFGASPCVPATPFETNGAILTPQEIETLLQRDDIYFLSEVMNFPGVINDDKDMLEKIAIAKKYNKPIDGHAPALSGDGLEKYINAGVQTDHEAFTYEEAEEKLQRGMKIQIRQGSAAKNYEALHPLIDTYYQHLMFCSDDKHPNDLLQGHINELVKQALHDGHNLFKVLQIASLNPVEHYNLDVGLLREGDKADFIEVENLEDFTLIRSFIEGKVVFENGNSLSPTLKVKHLNNFHTKPKTPEDFSLHVKCQEYRVIDAINSQLITKEKHTSLKIVEDVVQPDKEKDILIISVTNRYANTPPALAFVHGFHLSEGAIASSVAHDSHNIIAVGCDVKSVTQAVNAIIASKGGVCAVDEQGTLHHLPLPVAGLMSDVDGFEVAQRYESLDYFVKEQLHTTLDAPFMTLSFMALLVIPDIKLSDKGLFDGNNFHFIEECKI